MTAAKKRDNFVASSEVTYSRVSEEGPKYRWIVIFKNNSKIYTYMHRTVDYMGGVIADSYARHGEWPENVWAIVDGEMVRVKVES